MSSHSNKILFSILIVLLYFGIKYYIPGLYIIFYPVALLVTFMHELGHIIASLITGGAVHAMQINPDGSGFALINGGSTIIVLMGGYIGSAIIGNFLFYIALKKEKLASGILVFIALIMIFSALYWFSSVISSLLLIIFAIVIFGLVYKIKRAIDYVLMILGILSVVYIIEDFNVGPSSDLTKFSEIMPGTFHFWMFVWLGIVILISYFNFRAILKKG